MDGSCNVKSDFQLVADVQVHEKKQSWSRNVRPPAFMCKTCRFRACFAQREKTDGDQANVSVKGRKEEVKKMQRP